MTDVFTSEKRSAIMQAIRARNTKPEHVIRKLVHAIGCRYRLHDRRLPGAPDLVFASRKKVIFVNGCFWHRHNCRKGRSTPSTRKKFWQTKFEANMVRDRRDRRNLNALGWSVLTVWECQTQPEKIEVLTRRLIRFLA